MSNSFPKVVILYETFSQNSGGGITLTNLFKEWPKENIANIVDGAMLCQIASDDICSNFYALGNDERKTWGIFSFFQKNYNSGRYQFLIDQKINNHKPAPSKIAKLKSKLILSFRNLLSKIGLNNSIYRYEVSPKLLQWIEEFEPDIIYSQLSNYKVMKFTEQLVNSTHKKLVVHVMDDWFCSNTNGGMLSFYWKYRIDQTLRSVLDNASLMLSISEGMSDAYRVKYGKTFHPFHNPIETETWLIHQKKEASISTPPEANVLYAGRIGIGTSSSVIDIAKAIEELNREGYTIHLNIQTTSISPEIYKKLLKLPSVRFNSVVKYTQLPAVFSAADLLVLPIDFETKGSEFLKYSMPTKASEYMISGTPILVYCSPDVSLNWHAKKHNWALIVESKCRKDLKKTITQALYDDNLRKKLQKTATRFASSNYDAKIVREKFKQRISSI